MWNQLGNLDEMKANSNDNNFVPPENICNSNNRNEVEVPKLNKRYVFKPPQEAPVFYPSADEFQDSLNYITKIKPIAEQYGICKIVPPKGWQPPFSLNVDKLKFRPRVQKLNELDALSRLKLNFIDLLMKFWELQGLPISKPMIDTNKTLDLYTLWKLVQKEGGFEEVNKRNLWSSFAESMQYFNKNAATLLKNTYKYVLHPYDIYIANNSKLDFKIPKSSNNERKYKSKKAVTRRIFKDINEESNQKMESECSQNNLKQINSELHEKKVHISTTPSKSSALVSESNITTTKRESKNAKKVFNSVNSYNCIICNKDDKEELLMICVKCSANCHTFCSKPTFKEIPRGNWHCPTCLASEIRKVIPAYGFETCNREYNLQQFGEMADLFKCQYFRMQVHKVSNSMIEQEFWRILSDIDEKVAVEYGADLHSMDHGSGFPVYSSNNSTSGSDYYINSSWNLNNLPILEGSVLGHINADISGMKIPWMYVGMCFSTFCWHNEDHWSYSINYLHWGEVKTWYGVPGNMADAFEQAIRNIAPELFEAQADLLHQLVTIINPNLITAQNVPVYRLDQQAGEFVITFPRAYHAGFNQGYNFAEAVNFAPSDWIQKGRECIFHYANLKRYCVFSHDELICKMALSVNDLSYNLLEVLLEDLMTMIECERNYRKKLLENGVNFAERVYFELIPDNERMCNECKTTCFLSAIKCKCTLEKLCCLKHFNKVCTCSFMNYVLCYRYTMDELPRMVVSIKHRIKEYQEWLKNAEKALNPPQSDDINNCLKKNLIDFQQLVEDAKFWKDPKPEPFFALKKIIQIAECCIDVINQLELTRNSQKPKLPFDSKSSSPSSLESIQSNCNELTEHTVNDQKNPNIDLNEKKVSYDELIGFIEEIDNLPCLIDEKSILNNLLKDVQNFRITERELYNKNLDEINLKIVEELVLQSQKLCIRCNEIEEFYTKFKIHLWTKKINQLKNSPNSLKLDDYQELLLLKQKINDEVLIKDTKTIQVIEKTIKAGQLWERKADKFLNVQKKRTFEQLVQLLEEAQNIKAALKFEDNLLQYYRISNSWRIKIDKVYSLPYYPFCNIINEMYQKGLKLPVEFQELAIMKESLKECENWRCDLRKYFLRTSNSKFNIFDRLLPKTKYSLKYFCNNNITNESSCILNVDFAPIIDNVKFGDLTSGKDIEYILKARQKREFEYYRHIQRSHYQKFNFEKDSDNYCHCRRKMEGVMVMCNLCKEWFHSKCIEMPKKYIYRHLNEEVFSIVDKYLCLNCKRTRKPYLEDVVPLMEKLENLHIRLPESEVLHYLVDRAVDWRDKVKRFLREPEIVYWQSQYQTLIKQYIKDMKEYIRNPHLSRDYYQVFNEDSTIDDYENNLQHFEITFNFNLSIYMEKLIFLGDLMEFRTNETYTLWLIWQCTRTLTETPSIIILNAINNSCFKKIKLENDSKIIPNILQLKKTSVNKVRNDEVADESANSSSSSDDSCAATECIDPPDTKIDWVQCDGGCNQWFHLHCLGLKSQDINEEEDFICNRCRK